MTDSFVPEQILHRILSLRTPDPDDYLFLFYEKNVLFSRIRHASALLEKDGTLLYTGMLNQIPCYAAERVSQLPPELPEPLSFVPARQLLAQYETGVQQALSRGREMLFWSRQHRFCGSCGKEMSPSETDLAMICPDCKAHFYPQIAPAVITAILRKNGQEILLAHNRNFQNGVYSLIAGFVEAGESAEQTVRREIREEVGIEVERIRFHSSQAWPFPNSLMLGFTAEYESGDICPDGTEITDAAWFPLDHLPSIPSRGSIARAIIDQLSGK